MFNWFPRLSSFCLLALSCVAQSARPAFDVVSVKPTPRERLNQLKFERCNDGGPFIVEGTPVLWSIQYAYRLRDADIAGAPGWLTSFADAYDITGKSESRATDDQCRLMLQSLLEDRFQLKLHHEQRERAVYNLTVARNGPKLRFVKPEDESTSPGVTFNGRHPAILAERSPAPGWAMQRLANFLADILDDGRPIFDKTNLTGIYSFNLDYSRDGIEHPLVGPALQDQLGLKLESGKALADTVVIDRIERPSGN
jgi:uncharacterized protein (TIGR03435 family)